MNASDWLDLYPFKTATYGTDNLEHSIHSLPTDEMDSAKFVLTNPQNLVKLIVLDVDLEPAWLHVQSIVYDDGMLEPNWVTVNPGTEHAHVGYALAEPVTVSPHGRLEPIQFLADVRAGLTAKFSADPSYNGRLTRNPLHPAHQPIFLHANQYSLRELRDKLGKIPRKDWSTADFVNEPAEGRNVTLFKAVSREAYRMFGKCNSEEELWSIVEGHAKRLNAAHHDPLPDGEVRAISRSISRWVWRRRNKLAKDFAAKQSHRSVKAHAVRWGDNAQRDSDIIEMLDRGHGVREVARLAGCSTTTVSKVSMEQGRKRLRQGPRPIPRIQESRD